MQSPFHLPIVEHSSWSLSRCLGVVDTELSPGRSFAVVLSKVNNFEFKVGGVPCVLPHPEAWSGWQRETGGISKHKKMHCVWSEIVWNKARGANRRDRVPQCCWLPQPGQAPSVNSTWKKNKIKKNIFEFLRYELDGASSHSKIIGVAYMLVIFKYIFFRIFLFKVRGAAIARVRSLHAYIR